MAIADISQSASKAELPIKALARLGHVQEALKYVNGYLKRLPKKESLGIVGMAELGASICLAANDVAGCERYLRQAANVDQFITRKCDLGFGTNSVRKFKAFHGLLDPSEAADDAERIEATFHRAERQCREAISRGNKPAARNLLLAMSECTTNVEDWLRSRWLESIIEHAAALGDFQLIKQVIAGVPPKSRRELLDFSLFAKIGMKKEAIAAAVTEIKSDLAKLQDMEDPNIHFPIADITRALQCA